jgi:hypothetical protein
LLAEVIIFWTTFFFLSFPQLYLVCIGKKRIEKSLNASSDDEDEDDKDKKSDDGKGKD